MKNLKNFIEFLKNIDEKEYIAYRLNKQAIINYFDRPDNDTIVVYIDGASSKNPGPAAAGGVGIFNNKEIFKFSKFLGIQTSNYAEYSAFILALNSLIKYKKYDIIIYTDSNLLYQQINGKFKIKSKNIIPLYLKAIKILESFSNVKVCFLSREDNNIAHNLAQIGLEKNKY